MAKATPTTRAPTRPGPCVTPTAASSLGADGSALKTKRCRGILERRVHDAHDHLNVLARSDLGHYAAKTGMKIDLRRNLIGQHITVRIDNRHSRLIARTLDGKHQAATLNFGALLNGSLGCR